MRAFDLFRSELDSEFKLVLVGERMFMTGEMNSTLASMKHKKDVIFTGRLSPPELRLALGASAGMTFVPLFEGFGIPLLEAMRSEIPILTSNVTSLPEIAANAALYANPQETAEISKRMMQLATDTELRSRLISAGKKRAGDFSWDKTSERYWNSICRLR